MKSLRLLLLLAFAAAAHAADLFPFQLPWDDASESATNVSWLNDKPAGRDGFVRVKDGHLFAGEKRLRIFGVNTCFAANFPDKDMAPKVAARMAKFGINCVRFHHMDMMSAPGGIFAQDGLTLDPGQLDRLDFFIAELKKNGIYADLNLHVSRTYPDRPRAEKKGNPDFDKGVDNFCAAMIALQRDYVRDLLTHVNAYTGNRYADEPAVALVEINNENALGFQWWAGQMDGLPGPYRDELESLWSRWILKKYGSDEKARSAWSDGAREAGAEMLAQGAGAPRPASEKRGEAPRLPVWAFEQHGGAVAKGVEKDGAITVSVEKPGTERWHVQFSAAPLAVKAGSYEVRFLVRAPKDASLSVALMQSHEPWKVLGSVNVKPDAPGTNMGDGWHEHAVTIKVTAADDKARLTIGGMGTTTGTFEFSYISLRTAEVDGSLKRNLPWVPERVPIVIKRDLARTTMAKQRDWQEFIWDTETAYWNGMRDFLKKELGVKAPIVGTQGFWSPGHVQAGMDVIDSHAYWHHPDFHGKGWNPDVWDVKNEPMAGAPDGGTLPGLAAQRVAGKPFLCTEYNHPAPNTHSAETFPLLCAFAALQDWDGVFAFSYSHRGSGAWTQDHFDNFFDIDRHPVKMATLPAAVTMWRKGEWSGVDGGSWSVSHGVAVQRAIRDGPGFMRYLWSETNTLDEFSYKQFAIGLVDWGKSEGVRSGGPYTRGPRNNHAQAIEWATERRLADFIGARSAMFAGRLPTGSSFRLSRRITDEPKRKYVEITVRQANTRQGWGCFQFTVLDRDERVDFATAKRILITATGDIENTGMGWKNAEKTSVGRDWGKAPVLVEGPAAKIELPGGGNFKVWALDERGQRRAEIPVRETSGGATLEIGPQHRTLWYEVERQ